MIVTDRGVRRNFHRRGQATASANL